MRVSIPRVFPDQIRRKKRSNTGRTPRRTGRREAGWVRHATQLSSISSLTCHANICIWQSAPRSPLFLLPPREWDMGRAKTKRTGHTTPRLATILVDEKKSGKMYRHAVKLEGSTQNRVNPASQFLSAAGAQYHAT